MKYESYKPTKWERRIDDLLGLASTQLALKRMINRERMNYFRYLAAQPTSARQNSPITTAGEWLRIQREKAQVMWNAIDMVDNSGLCSGIQTKFPTYICGTLRWQARTGDKNVNTAYQQYIQQKTGKPTNIDITGRASLRQMCILDVKSIMLKGDVGTNIIRGDDKELYLQGIEANRIGDPYKWQTSDTYVRGLTIDPNTGAIVSVRVFYQDRRSGTYKLDDEYPTRDARGLPKFLFFTNPISFDDYRGVSLYKHAIDNSTYIDRMRQYELQALLWAASQSGVYYTKSGALPQQLPFSANPMVDASGNTIETFATHPNQITALSSDGERVEMFQHDRPSPNVIGMYENTIIDISVGAGLTKQFTWGMSGTGPEVRMASAQDARAVEMWQSMLRESKLDTVIMLLLGDAIAKGDVPYHPNWLTWDWYFPAKPTIDVGRESQANIEEINACLNTGASVVSDAGEGDIQDVITQRGHEIGMMIDAAQDEAKKRNLDWEQVYALMIPPPKGTGQSGGMPGAAKIAADKVAAQNGDKPGATDDGVEIDGGNNGNGNGNGKSTRFTRELIHALVGKPDDVFYREDQARAPAGSPGGGQWIPEGGGGAAAGGGGGTDVGSGVTRTTDKNDSNTTHYDGPGGRATVHSEVTQYGKRHSAVTKSGNTHVSLGHFPDETSAHNAAATRASGWNPDKPMPVFDKNKLLGKPDKGRVKLDDLHISQESGEDEGQGWMWHYAHDKGGYSAKARMLTSPERGGRTAVRLLETMPEHQGKGYATALVEHAKNTAISHGSKELISDPEGGIKPEAAKIFERMGADKIPMRTAPEGSVYRMKLPHPEMSELDKRLVDYKPDRSLSDPTKTTPVEGYVPNVRYTPYSHTPFFDTINAMQGTWNPATVPTDKYVAAREELFNKQPIEDVPLDKVVATQEMVNKDRVKQLVDDPSTGGDKPIMAVRYKGETYIMNGHHRVAADMLRGENTIKAHVLDVVPPPESDHDIPRWVSDLKQTKLWQNVNSELKSVAPPGASAAEVEGWSKRKNQINGEYTPERQQLHENIINKFLNPKAVVPEGQKPHVVFVIGKPGSGKTTLGTQYAQKYGEATYLNPDDIRGYFPEYNGINAAATQAESKDVFTDLAHRTISQHMNAIMDYTGSNTTKTNKDIDNFAKQGYDVHVVHVDVPMAQAAPSVWNRFQHQGRYIDMDYLLGDVNGNPENTYKELKKNPNVKGGMSIDNTVFGQPHIVDEWSRK